MMTGDPQTANKRRLRPRWAQISRAGAILLVILGVAAWIAGTVAASRLAQQDPVPGQLVDGGGDNISTQQPDLAEAPPAAGSLNAPAAQQLADPSTTATLRPAASHTPAATATDPAPPAEVAFTVRTAYEAGKMLYIGVGGEIDGVVSPDLAVTPGSIVRVTLVNDDGLSHDIYFPDFEARSAAIGRKGQTTEVAFTIPADAAAGAYVYYCTKPGHRQSGQEGWLMVKPAE